jgi:hypothetical protein
MVDILKKTLSSVDFFTWKTMLCRRFMGEFYFEEEHSRKLYFHNLGYGGGGARHYW